MTPAKMPTVLITGANRGIGLEFVKHYVQKGWNVIAAVRTVSSFPKVEGNVRVVQIVSESLTDAHDVAKQLQKDNITLDVIIANAAINNAEDLLVKTDPTEFDQHLNVNVRGVLVLFQALHPLLAKDGKFIIISSGAGTIGQDLKPRGGTYGLTKAALNYLTRQLHFEHPEYLIAAFSPGWLATEMGTRGAKLRGLDAPPDDITKTIPGMIQLIDEGNKEKLGGWMTNWDGTRMKW
ncbi:hypothetical protein DB88DRAFT_510689 [Papiliotrema laurentii]|uniref:Uncharacterized protein n=1 Tax=Papiliotrema laurentii TaxID=5418 RepID=A0AAD9D172_PAPLA|nr:hypothetical protein DB88DRAFT_510689 [Papiliotrema laurentii]